GILRERGVGEVGVWRELGAREVSVLLEPGPLEVNALLEPRIPEFCVLFEYGVEKCTIHLKLSPSVIRAGKDKSREVRADFGFSQDMFVVHTGSSFSPDTFGFSQGTSSFGFNQGTFELLLEGAIVLALGKMH